MFITCDALDWAFSADCDHDLGVALTVAAVPLLIRLSLLNECRERSERALAVLQDEPATAVARMQLYAALGWSLAYGVGQARETAAAWTKTLELAEVLGNIEFRRHALWGLCIDQFNTGNVRTALSYAEQFAGLVSSSDSAIERMKAVRILATSLHYLGDQKRAHHHIDQALSYEEVVAQSRSHTVSAGFDLLVAIVALSVAERTTQGVDLDLQVRFFHERCWPGAGNQVVLADHLARAFDQRGQDVERAAAESHPVAALEQKPLCRKKPKRAKGDRVSVHGGRSPIQLILPGFARPMPARPAADAVDRPPDDVLWPPRTRQPSHARQPSHVALLTAIGKVMSLPDLTKCSLALTLRDAGRPGNARHHSCVLKASAELAARGSRFGVMFVGIMWANFTHRRIQPS